MKVGLFGGTFDPVHMGHVNLAKALIERSLLERIIFIPAAKPPHKPGWPIIPFSHRYKMVELAIEGMAPFSLSNIEASRLPIPSYTFDTVNEFKKSYPLDELFLIIGEDSLLQIHSWYKAKELVKLCKIITYPRQNDNSTLEKLLSFWEPQIAKELSSSKTDLELFEVSSTQIREAIRSGRGADEMLPPKVLMYIREHGLYS